MELYHCLGPSIDNTRLNDECSKCVTQFTSSDAHVVGVKCSSKLLAYNNIQQYVHNL